MVGPCTGTRTGSGTRAALVRAVQGAQHPPAENVLTRPASKQAKATATQNRLTQPVKV